MRASRLAMIVLVVTVFVALVPLAHSRPPDPTWLSGLWDNADHDDAVTTVTGSSGLVYASEAGRLGWMLNNLGSIFRGCVVLVACPLTATCSRAPPP